MQGGIAKTVSGEVTRGCAEAAAPRPPRGRPARVRRRSATLGGTWRGAAGPDGRADASEHARTRPYADT
ncbi:hypothetical protein GCM10022284_71790 [Streptomyces hundungensis]